jgi:glycosyltransferase involved in cell wall biosynthesis
LNRQTASDALKTQAKKKQLKPMPYFSSTAIVPAFNRADYLPETLRALQSQQVPFSEIIVIDDGSDDGTENLVKREFPTVRYAKTPNRGVQHARNLGAQLANSEWLTFCDSDDLLDVDHTSKINYLIERRPEIDLVYVNFRFLNNGKTSQDTYSKLPAGFFSGAVEEHGFVRKIPEILQKIMLNQFLWHSGISMRKEALNLIGGYDSHFRHVASEDLEFTLRAVSQLNFAFSIPALSSIRKHENNQSVNPIRQRQGEITVLRHYLATHPFARMNEDVILKSIAERRNALIVLTFEKGDFSSVRNQAKQLNLTERSLKSNIKFLISLLPRTIRNRIWAVIMKMRH